MSIFEPEEAAPEQVEQQVEPTVEATPEPEVKADATVPLSALNESRAAQRQQQNEINALKEQLGEFSNLRDELNDYRKGQTQTETEAEFNNDPLGTLKNQIDGLQETITTTNTQNEQREAQERQQQQITENVARQVNQFREEHPDYDLALKYMVDGRRQELAMMGMPEHEIDIAMNNEAYSIAQNALGTNQNPGQMVYNYAKLRGYQPAEPETKGKAQLDVIERGQQSASSLSNSSGSEAGTGLSLTDIESMSDADFDKYWDSEVAPKNF